MIFCDVLYCFLVTRLQVFYQCDEEKKSFLSREDLKVSVIMLFGYKPSKVNPGAVARGRHCAGFNLTRHVLVFLCSFLMEMHTSMRHRIDFFYLCKCSF